MKVSTNLRWLFSFMEKVLKVVSSSTSELNLKRLTWLLIFFWSSIMIFLTGWDVLQSHISLEESALFATRERYVSNLSLHSWASQNGGVYVPITKDIQPDSFMGSVPGSEIVTSSGMRLALVSPTYLINFVHDASNIKNSSKIRLASLEPLHPDNTPDEWERIGLEVFNEDDSEGEVYSIEEVGGGSFFRYLKKLEVTEACLKCHSQKAYEVGDIMGGLSMMTDWKPYQDIFMSGLFRHLSAYFFIWILGLVGIYFGIRQFLAHLKIREHAEKMLKENLSLLEMVIKNFPGGMVVLNGDSQIVMHNEVFKEVFGIPDSLCHKNLKSSFEKILRHNLLDQTNHIEDDITCLLYVIMKKMQIVQDFHFEHTTSNGKYLQVQAKSLNGAGFIVGFFDVTKNKEIQQKLEDRESHLEYEIAKHTKELHTTNSELIIARDLAESSNRSKSAFLANMSHELRSPLNGVLGYLQIVKSEGLNTKHLKYIEKAEKSGKHLARTINDILDFSRIEAGSYNLEEVPVNIHNLLSDVRSLYSGRAEARGVELNIGTCATFPTNLVGDETRLKQNLINYVSNALKFTQKGSVVMQITKEKETRKSLLVRFEVIDTGKGLSVEEQDLLFKPFVQVDSSHTRRFGGTGLGLAITLKFANLMGGDAGVTSKKGTGSTFWFTARLKKRNQEDNKVVDVKVEDYEKIIKKEFSGSRILLAEDNLINQEVARIMLESVGFVVDLASDGKEAFTMVKETKYSIVLMDMQMPEVSGVEATHMIRLVDDHKDLPIIAITANAFTENKEECFAAGMNDFILKPFEKKVLLTVLLKWLRRKQ